MNAQKIKTLKIWQVILRIYAGLHFFYLAMVVVFLFRMEILATASFGERSIYTTMINKKPCVLGQLLWRFWLSTGEMSTSEHYIAIDGRYHLSFGVLYLLLAIIALIIARKIGKKVASATVTNVFAPMEHSNVVANTTANQQKFLFTCSRCGHKMVEFTKFCPNCAAPSSEFIMNM